MSQFSSFVSRGSLGVINLGLHPASDETMRSLLGHPKGGLIADDCRNDLASDTVQRLKETRNFGHFNATGIKLALESLQRIFDAVKTEKPELFDAVGNAGMLCVRLRRPTSGAPSTLASNHSWGTAIDIKIDDVADVTADERVQRGIAELIPFFNNEGWFSGVGFASSEDDTHFEVAEETIQAWAARGLFDPPEELAVAANVADLAGAPGPLDQALQDRVIQIAAASDIARFNWPDRGVAPAGYIKGMAVVYAQIYAKLKAGDRAATEMAKANSGDADHDVLAWYASEFSAAGMRNNTDGPDTLRHLFVLMIGLGMRESSGRYWVGRDKSASNLTADTAEAGLFQTSFDARKAHSLLPEIFERFRRNPVGFLEIFKEGAQTPSSVDLENFGSGDGAEFQRLSKTCPAFAAEFTAVALRHARTHWGPIINRAVQIHVDGDAILKEVQNAVDAVPVA
jgi:hypothetical protein